MLLGFFLCFVFYLYFTGEWCTVWEQCNIIVCAWAKKKNPTRFFSNKHASKTCPLSHVCTLARRSWQLATRSLFSIVRRAGLFFCFLLSLFSPHVAFCGHSDTLMAAKCSLGILLESFFFFRIYAQHVLRPSVYLFRYRCFFRSPLQRILTHQYVILSLG